MKVFNKSINFVAPFTFCITICVYYCRIYLTNKHFEGAVVVISAIFHKQPPTFRGSNVIGLTNKVLNIRNVKCKQSILQTKEERKTELAARTSEKTCKRSLEKHTGFRAAHSSIQMISFSGNTLHI